MAQTMTANVKLIGACNHVKCFQEQNNNTKIETNNDDNDAEGEQAIKARCHLHDDNVEACCL